MGGGRLLEPEGEQILAELYKVVARMGLTSGIVINTSADKSETWSRVGDQLLKRIGSSNLGLFDVFGQTIPSIKLLESAQIFFLSGGHPDKFLTKIRALGVFDNISACLQKNNVLVIGVSAGALILNKTCYISRDDDYPQELFLDGLAICNDFITETHYREDKFDLIKNAGFRNRVIAIEDNSAIFYSTVEMCTFGKVHFLPKLSHKTRAEPE